MKSTLDLPFPPRWVNAFVHQELAQYEDIGIAQPGVGVQQLSPILATSPTNVEELYSNLLQSFTVGEPLMIIYDRLITFRPTPFYPHKREQLVYYLYSTNLSNVNNAYVVISQLLDREDSSAEDLNRWIRTNNLTTPGTGDPYGIPAEYYPKNVRFHNTKVYVAQEARDLLDLASARTMYVNKLIIEYDYTQITASERGTPGDPSKNYM